MTFSILKGFERSFSSMDSESTSVPIEYHISWEIELASSTKDGYNETDPEMHCFFSKHLNPTGHYEIFDRKEDNVFRCVLSTKGVEATALFACHFYCHTTTPDHMGCMTPIGAANVMVYELCQLEPNKPHVYNIYHRTVSNAIRGRVQITFVRNFSPNTKIVVPSWVKNPQNIYGEASELTKNYIERSLRPYRNFYKPSVGFLSRVHTDYYTMRAFDLPSFSYCMSPVYIRNMQTTIDEIRHLLQMALVRWDVSEEEFVNSVQEQLESDGEEVTQNFHLMCTMVADMIRFFPACCPYVPDVGHSFGNDRKHIKLHNIEAYKDMGITQGGDCEDAAMYSDRLVRLIKMIPLDSAQKENRSLIHLQKLLNLYVSAMILSSVTAASANSHGKSEDMAHVFTVLLPWSWVQDCIKRFDSSSPLLPSVNAHVHKKWSKKLLTRVSDGTGWVDPAQLPKNYYVWDNNSQSAQDEANYQNLARQNNEVNVPELTKLPTFITQSISDKQMEIMNLDEYSPFYRRAVSFWSTEFLQMGKRFVDFGFLNKDNTYGIRFCDLISCNPQIKIMPVTEITTTEIQLVNDFLGHLHPTFEARTSSVAHVRMGAKARESSNLQLLQELSDALPKPDNYKHNRYYKYLVNPEYLSKAVLLKIGEAFKHRNTNLTGFYYFITDVGNNLKNVELRMYY